MSDARSPDVIAISGAGGDPYATAIAENPYNVIPSLCPDDTRQATLTTQLALQRKGLSRAEDLALRVMSQIPARLVWDLLTLGTAQDLPAEQWKETLSSLRAGKRAEAEGLWREQPSDTSALHVRAVLSVNELGWEARENGTTSDAQLCRAIGLWTAILCRKDWLTQFALHRGNRWKLPVSDSDRAQFIARADSAVSNLLLSTLQPDKRPWWRNQWEREQAAIRMVVKACGIQAEPPAWPAGFGPLGLGSILGAQVEAKARKWLFGAARQAPVTLPIAALKAGEAGFFSTRPSRVAAAATATIFVFSGMGTAVAMIWANQGIATLNWLSENSSSEADKDPWFGAEPGSSQRYQAALQQIRAEAMLLKLQDELKRPSVSPDQVAETAAVVLAEADRLPQPRVVAREVEKLIVARVAFFLGNEGPPKQAGMDNAISAAREIHSLLLGRGEGQLSGQELAKALVFRARSILQTDSPRMYLRRWRLAIHDLLSATTLAPKSIEAAKALAFAVVNHMTGNPVEQHHVAQQALDALETSRRTSATATAQLEDAYDALRGVLDPEAARQRAIEKLDALRGARDQQHPSPR